MLEILYRDKYIVCCVKPVGVLSERDGNKQSMPKLLCEELCIPEVYSVHRLDKNVGGLMLWALNSFSASELACQISDGRVVKKYAALVRGTPHPSQGIMEDLLFHDSSKNKTYVATRMRKGVRGAKLGYETLETLGSVSLMRIRLYTGRTHQIRVQFASRNCPLVGDGRYGSGDKSDKPMLFAYFLSFTHPKTGKPMSFMKLPEFEGFPKPIIEKLKDNTEI